MGDIIIGGIIAAVTGLISGIILMLLREKRQQQAVQVSLVQELYAEVEFNKSLLTNLRAKWGNMDFETNSYQNNRGKIGFLPIETRQALNQAYYAALFLNRAMSHRREVSSTDSSFPTGELEGALKRCEDGLQAWLKSLKKDKMPLSV